MRRALPLFLALCLLVTGCAAQGTNLLGYVSDHQGNQVRIYGMNFGSNTSAVGTGVLVQELDPLGKGKIIYCKIGTQAGVLPQAFHGAVGKTIMGVSTLGGFIALAEALKGLNIEEALSNQRFQVVVPGIPTLP